MSVAAAQALRFYEQIVAERKVFTFLDDGDFIVFKIGEAEVIPFWSSCSRLERVQDSHPKYLKYAMDEQSLDDFLAKTLPLLHEEKIRIGVNWSGQRLSGYDVTVDELRKSVEFQLAKQSG